MPASIAMMEPFGTGNPEPVFGLYKMNLIEILPMGNGRHLRLFCSRDGANLQLVKFFMTEDEFPFTKGDCIDFAVSLEENEYRGEKTLSVIVKDMKPADFDTDKALHTLRIYESFCRKEQMKKATAAFLMPDRNFFAVLYRLLRQHEGWSKDEMALIAAMHCPGESVGRLLVALDVLAERGLIRRGNAAAGEKLFELLPTAGKADLEASPIFDEIRRLCVL
jgi:single-stranded-DNA-specific exonuclease